MGHNDHVPVTIVSTTQNIFIQPSEPRRAPRFQRFGGAAPFSYNSAAPDNFLEKRGGYDPYQPKPPSTPASGCYPDMFGDASAADCEDRKDDPRGGGWKKSPSLPCWAQSSSPRKDKGYIVRQQQQQQDNRRTVATRKSMPAAGKKEAKKSVHAPSKQQGKKKNPGKVKGEEGKGETSAQTQQKSEYAPTSIKQYSFVTSIYPTGTGPDVELIEMLERDMASLSRYPCSWRRTPWSPSTTSPSCPTPRAFSRRPFFSPC